MYLIKVVAGAKSMVNFIETEVTDFVRNARNEKENNMATKFQIKKLLMLYYYWTLIERQHKAEYEFRKNRFMNYRDKLLREAK